jgi:type VI secretion system secreted protein VgrG
MNRAINAFTPLGNDLMFSALSGREEMSRLFDFTVEFKSEKRGIALKAMIGQSVTIEMELQKGGKRYLNGQCSHFHATGKSGRYFVYEARIRPWLWYATRKSDYKIFQGMSVPEIVLDVLGKYPFPIQNRLSDSYRKWDYNVQYRETDFNYVSRLMEHEGIYYYFEHQNGEHTLVLCDDINDHSPFPGYASVPYYPPDSTVPDEDYFDTWAVGQAIDSGAFSTDDYDFTKPSADLATGRDKTRPHPHSTYEIYDFPGGYFETDHGERYSRVRMEELQADHELIQGFGEVRGAAPGRLLTLTRHPRADQNREYLIASAHYSIRDNSYESTSGEAMLSWRVSIEALPGGETYRPQRLTPKPHSMGPETAVVVGPPGEEIHTDKYGRVKVQFHWDRHHAKKDENSSCWIRVAMPWAGSTWGFIHIPRIGQEVLVDFIGGDPDYPIITGSVYNAEQMPPYGLPQNKTASGIKSRSSKGADSTDYNEFRFEDMKGQEQVYLHAQRNLDSVVELDESCVVGQDRQTRIGRNDQRFVNNNDTHVVSVEQTMTVGGNQTESIGGKRMLSVTGDQEVSVGANATLNVSESMRTNIGTGNELTIGEDYACSVGGNTRYMFQTNLNSLVMGDRQAVIKGNDERTVLGNSSYMASDYALTTATNYSLTVGAQRSALVMGTDDTKITGTQSNMIGGSQTNTIGTAQTNNLGSQTNQIATTQTTTVGGSITTTAAASMATTSGGAMSFTSGAVISMSAGGVMTISAGGAVTINAPAIILNAASVLVSGVLTATTVTTTSVVSPAYTPGVGNLV